MKKFSKMRGSYGKNKVSVKYERVRMQFARDFLVQEEGEKREGASWDVSGVWAALCAGQSCCYTEGSATSPKVLISRLVERQRTVMWRALTLVHTPRQWFPPGPRGTEERGEEQERCKTEQWWATNKDEQQSEAKERGAEVRGEERGRRQRLREG